jgi:hypothetical protein
MEQFKASDEDWRQIKIRAKNYSSAEVSRAVLELRDRVAALEAAPAAAPAAAVLSDQELQEIWKSTQGGAIEHFRALVDHGYQQGLAAGRAEQQATTEPATDPAMTALELPRDWYPDFADWLKRQMPEGTVIGDPLWWASCIAAWLMAKATLGPKSSPSPAAGDAGLVEEVLDAMGEGTEVEARKAICKVAARARAHDLNGMSPAAMTWEGVARWLEQEANR